MGDPEKGSRKAKTRTEKQKGKGKAQEGDKGKDGAGDGAGEDGWRDDKETPRGLRVARRKTLRLQRRAEEEEEEEETSRRSQGRPRGLQQRRWQPKGARE